MPTRTRGAPRNPSAGAAAPAEGQGLCAAYVDLAGRVLGATSAVESLYGYPPEVAVGQMVALVLPEERRGLFAELLEKVRTGEEIAPYLALHRHLDGSDVPVEVIASPVFGARGEVSGAFVLLRDLRPGAASRAARDLGAVGDAAPGSGALAFQIDLFTAPPTFWVSGDRSLFGLEGVTASMGRVAPSELDDKTAEQLLAVARACLEGRGKGSRVAEVTVSNRPRRWLAVRAEVVEGDELCPSVLRGVALDVTEQYLGLDGTHQELDQAATFVIGIRLCEPTRLEYVSASAAHFTGYQPEELLQGGTALLRSCLDPALVERFGEDVASGEVEGSSYEYRTFRRDGSSLWVRTTARILHDEGDNALLEVTAVDVNQTKLVELEVSRLSLVDALTGAASRRALEEAWLELCTERAGGKGWAALAYVDVDRFGLVNSGLGMVAGDEMLKLVADRLRRVAGEEALVARIGADDFVVLAGSLPGQAAAVAFASQLVGAGSEPMPIGGREIYGTVSVGATIRRLTELGPLSSLDDHLAEAHVALRAAKAHNGGGAEIFAEGMRSQAQAKIETHSALRRGMEEGQFLLHYQPIVDLRSAEPVGAEALLRWEHPTRGLLLPSEFITLAEETGSIVELGGWVIEEACRSAAAWPATSLGELTVAVNLSARQLVAPDLVERVTDVLERVGLDPERLMLEITETSVIHDLDGAGWTLRRLADIGVRFALDDFGTGYSSLVYLVQLPIDRVKVDRSLVAGLPHAMHSQAVLAAVVGMAEAMEIHAIAEGVETGEQIAVLNELGCCLAQGFYFSPPLTEDRLLELISAPAR